MFSIERLRAVLAVLAFLLACVFAECSPMSRSSRLLTSFDRAVCADWGSFLGAGAPLRVWIANRLSARSEKQKSVRA